MNIQTLDNGHQAIVTKPTAQEMTSIALLPAANEYAEFWTAKIGSNTFYIGTGYKGDVVRESDRKQKVVWYPNGRFWSGYGMTFKQALDGAIENAWRYMV
jgi:hypothetical protein